MSNPPYSATPRCVLALGNLLLATACDLAPAPFASSHQDDVSASRRYDSPSLPVEAPVPIRGEGAAPQRSNPASGPSVPARPLPATAATPNPTPSLDDTGLKPTIQQLLSPKLFELAPAAAPAYFTDIAQLQQQEIKESWSRQFAGSSQHLWMVGATLELLNDSGRWRLGQATVAWKPPKQHARALYDRLVAQVKSARRRKPNFGRDESDDTRERRSAGWTWCKQECEAYVLLDSSGRGGAESPLITADGQPVVLLTVYVPEGP